ncbi:MAG TPA: hypothetical protein VE422_30780 [Terriglobia bacterium]|nr:hypothetical protein [Terriglobia bacterium]
MAWRPYSNLIFGELDNRIPGKVTGWMQFFRRGDKPLWVTFDLTGDFHEDIRGKLIRVRNVSPSDYHEKLDRKGTYMDGFDPIQRGTVGDMTAGRPLGPFTEELAQKLMAQNELHWDEIGLKGIERERRRREFADKYRASIEAGELYYCYVPYPYLEWYSDNGRVVLELDPSQIVIVDDGKTPKGEKTPEELVRDRKKRKEAFGSFMTGMVESFSEENRRKGGDGNVTGIVI